MPNKCDFSLKNDSNKEFFPGLRKFDRFEFQHYYLIHDLTIFHSIFVEYFFSHLSLNTDESMQIDHPLSITFNTNNIHMDRVEYDDDYIPSSINSPRYFSRLF
jgi:hypothetical protein